MLFFVIDIVFFFFKQKTAYEMRISDWSSDVCSSDLDDEQPGSDQRVTEDLHVGRVQTAQHPFTKPARAIVAGPCGPQQECNGTRQRKEPGDCRSNAHFLPHVASDTNLAVAATHHAGGPGSHRTPQQPPGSNPLRTP